MTRPQFSSHADEIAQARADAAMDAMFGAEMDRAAHNTHTGPLVLPADRARYLDHLKPAPPRCECCGSVVPHRMRAHPDSLALCDGCFGRETDGAPAALRLLGWLAVALLAVIGMLLFAVLVWGGA